MIVKVLTQQIEKASKVLQFYPTSGYTENCLFMIGIGYYYDKHESGRGIGIRALNLGASGYLSKDIALEHLIPAIRRVASGKVFISQVLAESIAQNISRDPEAST